MRLIDADVLKADFKERNIWNSNIVSAIDSIPTVKVENCGECPFTENRYIQQENSAPVGRLKSEWRYCNSWNTCRCSVCGEFSEFGASSYCSNCGADMRSENKFQDLVVFDDQPKRQLEDPDCHNEL